MPFKFNPLSGQFDLVNTPFDVGGGLTGTNGSVLFIGASKLAEDNPNLFWDNTNKRLGIGTNTPNNKLQVAGFLNADDTLNNLSFGTGAGASLTTGQFNLFLGTNAGANTTNGSLNVCIGKNAGTNNIGAGENFFLGASNGFGAIGASGQANVSIGKDNLSSMTTASHNIAIGKAAMNNSTTATNNTIIGDNAGTNMKTSQQSVCIGFLSGAGFANNTQTNNTFLGTFCGWLSSGNLNTCIGEKAGQSAGSSNVMIGYNAGMNEAGSNKLYISNSNTATPLIYGDFSTSELTTNGNLLTNGGEYKNIITVSTAYSILPTDGIILVDTTASNLIVTLPSAASAFKTNMGLVLNIKHIGTGVNTMTIEGFGTELVDGNLNKVSLVKYESFSLISNGTSWFII